MRWLPLLIVLSALVSSRADAAFVFFTDRSAWESAAGPIIATEDFSSFAADTQFRTQPVLTAVGTLAQLGPNAYQFRNKIDVPTLQQADNNGTANASVFVEGDRGTAISLTFASPVRAYGQETWSAADAEGAILQVYDGTTLLGSANLVNNAGAFLGFVTEPGVFATSIRLVAASAIGDETGDGFGLDNLAIVAGTTPAVPEPGTLALLSLGGIGLAASKLRIRRKKVAAA